MKKEVILKALQENARHISELEDRMLNSCQTKLSELLFVKRIINFKVQDLVRESEEKELIEHIDDLEYSLFSSMTYHRDNKIMYIAELYAVAIDALLEYRTLVCNYL